MLKKIKIFKICKKSENTETPYKNLEKYGSFSEFRTSTEKYVMLATLVCLKKISLLSAKDAQWASFAAHAWHARVQFALHFSLSSAQRMLKHDLGYHLYKLKIVQQLNETDFSIWKDFYVRLVRHCRESLSSLSYFAI